MRQTCARAVGSSVGHVVLVRGDGDVQRLLSGGPGPMAHGHFGGRACEAGGGAGGAGNAGPKWAGAVCVSGGPWGGPCSGGQASVRGGAGLDEYRGPCESSHVCGPPTRPGHLVTARRALSAHLPPLVTLPPPPPRRNVGYVTCAQAADKTKRRRCGSSVAYKTIGTFLLKVKRKDARG